MSLFHNNSDKGTHFNTINNSIDDRFDNLEDYITLIPHYRLLKPRKKKYFTVYTTGNRIIPASYTCSTIGIPVGIFISNGKTTTEAIQNLSRIKLKGCVSPRFKANINNDSLYAVVSAIVDTRVIKVDKNLFDAYGTALAI